MSNCPPDCYCRDFHSEPCAEALRPSKGGEPEQLRAERDMWKARAEKHKARVDELERLLRGVRDDAIKAQKEVAKIKQLFS